MVNCLFSGTWALVFTYRITTCVRYRLPLPGWLWTKMSRRVTGTQMFDGERSFKSFAISRRSASDISG